MEANSPAAAAASSSPANARVSRVQFSGKGGEYFRLWIVNALLTLVTLGLYSPWAKVRNTQYLYGHTSVDSHRFAFLATPIQILKGRLIALAVIVVASFIGAIHPAIQLVISLVFIGALPWLILQGIRFALRMTSYRNVRFDFTGTYGGMLLRFFVFPMLSVFTLFLAMPWVIKEIDNYLHNHVKWGDQAFELNNRTGEYYITALICGAFTVVLYAVIFAAGGAAFFAIAVADAPSASVILGAIGVYLVFIAGMELIRGIWVARIRNHVMNNLTVGHVASFKSDVPAGATALMMLTNLLMLVFTLGLAFPVTRIRMARLLSQHTEIAVDPVAADAVVNRVESRDSAFGEEAADLLDVGTAVLG